MRNVKSKWPTLAGLAALLLASPALASTLITGATVYDGSGAAGAQASVRVDGDRIVAVGKLRPRKGEVVISGEGLVLAPGFIDAHSHHDRGDYTDQSMPLLLAQGVTTIVIGQDGESAGAFADLAGKFVRRPAAINVASYTGHGHLRDVVMGKDYKRTAAPAELLSLARTAAAGGGRYISHMRNEDVTFNAALDELLDLGEKTGIPVQVSHISAVAAYPGRFLRRGVQ